MPKSRKYPLLNDKAWLERKYLEERLSPRGISELLGCCSSSVENALKRFKIPIRNLSESMIKHPLLYDKRWLEQKYLGEWLSLDKIAQILRCGRNTVTDVLKEFDIPIRTKYDALISHKELRDKSWLEKKYVEERLSTCQIAELLGGTTTSVLAALKRHGVPTRGHSESMIHYKDLHDKEWLENAYLKKKLTGKEVGNIVGCAPTTVSIALRNIGVPTRSLSEAKEKYKKIVDKLWLKRKYEDEKLSCIDIGKIVGCCHQTVIHSLIRYGIPVRSSADAYLCRKVRRGVCKTSIEVTLEEIFSKYTDCIRYTGNSSLWIKTANNSFNPDFVVDGKKIAIEANGDYWHSPLLNRKVKENGEVNYRKKALKKVGWKLIVFWETDIRRKDADRYVLHVLRKEGVV